jgi:murein endopeptidase
VRVAAAVLIVIALGTFVVSLRADQHEPPARARPAPADALRAAPCRPERRHDTTRRPRPPSRAIGVPWAGRLVQGRRLPVAGQGFLSWDPILKRTPDRGWRRWATGRLLHAIRTVLAGYAGRHPAAGPVLVGDLSRRHGGDFGPRFGGIGHASHQNGLDADIYYPRRDGVLRPARVPAQVDHDAAQELVDAFLRVDGVERIFVGPSLGLHGPPGTVQPLAHHDDHLHLRLAGR